MSKEDLRVLIRDYPIPEGWYARVPSLQESANYGTKFEMGIYEEQEKSGYRLPLHPFALRFFEHYHMAPRQLVLNSWRKLVGLIYLVETSGYKPDRTDFIRVFFEIYFVKEVANCSGSYYIHRRQRLLKGGPKSNIVGREDKEDLPFDRDWNPYCKDFENLGKPTPTNLTKHILSHIKLRGGLSIDEPFTEQQLEYGKIIPGCPFQRVVEGVSIDKDPIFRPRWTLRRDDMGMPNSQVSEQHLLHGVLPKDKEVFQNQTHESFACSFAQAVYTVTGSTMLSRFDMAREVAADEAQQKRDAIREAEEATRCAEELSKWEVNYLAYIETLERRLKREKKKAVEEVKKVAKARDKGIRDFLDGNAGEEWLKKRTNDGLEIYEMGFAKAKEIVEYFPDIPLDDFVMPAVVSPSVRLNRYVSDAEEGRSSKEVGMKRENRYFFVLRTTSNLGLEVIPHGDIGHGTFDELGLREAMLALTKHGEL
ncbi:hypothetical protein RJ639_025417 [Escallonia herrerae]|uniref:Transposase (putative) gypsy type domain-containing protein n=1 Tax=Escallonia herrerae TaxID=1293975 RepID=A0AA89AC09_9ASTE|nr:hypothetical protein RJ639_025417 [Escallonia herrerae]